VSWLLYWWPCEPRIYLCSAWHQQKGDNRVREVSLKRTRDRFKITQKVLAEHVGVTPNTIARYEQGNLEVPTPVTRLVALLSADWLEHGYKNPEEMWRHE
jgi:DNA-binding XRE family transcriptional regulator